MSRIGRQPVRLPKGVDVSVAAGTVTVKGPKGMLTRRLHPRVSVNVAEGKLLVERANNSKLDRALHGTTRALMANMVEGVTKGFEKKLEIQGVGYRARLTGRTLDLSVGKVKPCVLTVPQGIEVTIEKNTLLTVTGIDKELVGQVAANIRRFRPPEPYLGKGVRYVDEHVRRKAGKTVG
ncbi:MAG: 50S ribosomal protein L6 [Verrucomicrobia bacterium]|nr:50S ribosomal protein L6 [Verrucomicrobiota bacterium]